ncbi:hypothetical protein SLEP1_g45131 [Rubroshorea leprosula]|uniref:Reverse transcriptase domain-containing protein n=1 Tax=Rubroshorea leprosula TaxID=152421 RepID=A0AAV5LIR6_9ROSI|nr:hypothetical protein SLEP1_g45131 [Rubroshorea leprosula]
MKFAREPRSGFTEAREKERNRVIRQQIQLDEVQKLFMLGQRLGVKCQQNEEEVLSRGLGSVVKRKEISKLLRKENPDFLFIQETKLEQIETFVCRLVWNSNDFKWVMQKSNGTLGGLLCIWNKRNFVKRRVVEGQGFIGISGEWGKQQLQCTFVNIYAPCDRQSRVVLWGELSRLVFDEGGIWLLAGDFNAVHNSAERKGRVGETQDMEQFNLFVQGTGLVNLRLRNRKFTWYRPDGTSMSRLDRFLLSIEMSLMEGDWNQEGIRRSISDYCAIILKPRSVDWGPKPFQVLDKSRANWASLGDANTAFFHRSVHARRAQNKISSIYDDNGWVKEPEFVKAATVKYFTKEIEEGLNDCDGSKAPGPDGFNFNFIKFAWSTVKEDFVNFLMEFHRNGSVLVLNEVVHEVKWRKQESFILKADFEKAYDCVDWGFLDWMMNRMGFGVKWRKWMWECFSIARISILINGSPMTEFPVSNGLRQGLLKGVEIGRGGMVLSLLQFADDTLFMGKANVDNLWVVKAILNWCQLISGLKINFGKSYLYGFNLSEGWVKGAAAIMRCGVGKMPFTYLGLPVGRNSGRRQFWNPVLDRFRHKLASWKSPLLSFGGRITLINSVSWEYVCMDKGRGVLGVADLERRNCSLLGKWWYRLGDGVGGLWKRVLWEKYYGGRKEVDIMSVVTWNISGVWKDIMGLDRGSERLESALPKDVFRLADVVMAGINGGCWTELGTLVFLVTAWYVWFWRNLKVFGADSLGMGNVIPRRHCCKGRLMA